MPDSLNLPEILDNPLHVWLIAVIGGALVYLILRGVLKFVAARVRRREEFAPTHAGAVLLRLLRHTRRWLLFLLVMLVALAAPDLPPKLESLRQNAIVILVGLQLALWANSLIGLWLENVLKPGASRINPVMAAMLGWVGQVMVWTILLMFVLADTMPWIIVAFLLRGGMFASWAMMLAEMGERAPSRLRSRAFAVMEIMGGSAMAFGPIIASQLYRIDPSTPVLAGAILGGLMTIRIGWVQWRESTQATTQPATAKA